jgi:carbamoyl-phosphate synthase large subunit
MVNCNPETVSTDYDTSDKLYFEPLTMEEVMNIVDREKPDGVIVQFGGQTPLKLALALEHAGVPIIGTSPDSIDLAEDRERFSALINQLAIKQPDNGMARSYDEAFKIAAGLGYPVLVRPSYVLGGRAMQIVYDGEALQNYMTHAVSASPEHPVLIDKFLDDAIEVDVDALGDGEDYLIGGIMEHIERAGVHSGDATLVIPPQRTYLEVIRKIEKITVRIAQSLSITGPFNVQYLAQGTNVEVIEANLRASRSFPFVSKIYKINFIELAIKAILGIPVSKVDRPGHDLDYVGVKAPQFSFTRLQGADPTVGVEMASTGEVGCLGDDFEEAFLKALISVGFKFPIKTVLLSTGPLKDKVAFLEGAKALHRLGIKFFATQGTAEFLATYGIESVVVHWPLENLSPNAGELAISASNVSAGKTRQNVSRVAR